ncbi:MAG: type II toxin-antitoxin system RatA family toxin [Rhodospirillaceae bacterium]|nr:MAG: type II toxin-antitoxin system RatA family toxin [Rhodospirillaceae bacterium]
MKVHSEQRNLPYRAEQMFDLVADVGRYPEFLPWCVGARVREKREDLVVADLMIGFKMVRERFTSRVHLNRPDLRIDVEYIDGPFKYLKNHWTFADIGNGHCRVDFHLEFEFSSAVLQKLIGVLFHEAVRRMVHAFEMRAAQLYG